MYDYLIVGAGLFGATCARQARDAGKRCLVIDKSLHIAGHCYTEKIEGINVHRYGPHIFHTDSLRIWQFVQRFADFNSFTYRPRVSYRGRIFSFPINLMTLNQLWGVNTPAEARARLEAARLPLGSGTDLKSWLLSQVGREIYEAFFEGYTIKQWGRDPSVLPSSIVSRIPIRLTFDDNYFTHRYQGIPVGGYTLMVSRMLEGIEVRLGCDYFKSAVELNRQARKTVYTGAIDRFFEYCYGALEYRSLRFETEVLEGDFQGVACVNYTDAAIPYTRIVEHKHFERPEAPMTVITREYPDAFNRENAPFYPINDPANNEIYRKYQNLADSSETLFGGRLATYKYYDMHQVIAQALALAEREGLRPGDQA